jgi:aryl-alcohol dehydrogenase-like predicted oxidoreductase
VESVERSLKNLGIGHIDLFQCHRFDPHTPLEETVRAVSDLIRRGKVLYWGVSRWGRLQIEECLRTAQDFGAHAPISHQIPYNLLYRVAEKEILPDCQRWGMGALAYYPLSQGVLTGKYLNGALPKGSRAAHGQTRTGMYDLNPGVLLKLKKLVPIAEGLGITLGQLAIAWCLRKPAAACAITGATTPHQIEENAKSSGIDLSGEVVQKIDDLLEERQPEEATR